MQEKQADPVFRIRRGEIVMKKKQVIVLNGPSSSGKSSSAEALRKRIEEKTGERYEVVSIDDLMKTSPMETIYEDDVYEISGDLCQRVLEALETRPGVIVDHVITSRRIFDQLAEALRPFAVRLVRFTCPASVLREREQARGDRCPGSAESSAEYLYPKEGYELTVDTGALSLPEVVSEIFDKLF